MGTEYKVLSKNGIEVSIGEGSNVFELCLSDTREGDGTMLSDEGRVDRVDTHSVRLTPEDLIKFGLEALKVASYWCDSDEFNKAVIEYRGSHSTYEATMLRSIGDAATMAHPDAPKPKYQLEDDDGWG